ncbi:MAG: hypothetical protein WD042_14530 [Phycisphaeraceae bacterium]
MSKLPKSSPELHQQLEALQLQAFQMHTRWTMWKQLFARGRARREFLSSTADNFFLYVDASFRDCVWMSLCRLTDPDKSNLTISRALTTVGYSLKPRQRRWQLAALKVLSSSMTTIRQIRNRRLGHNDLSTATGKRTLSRVEYRVTDRAVYCAIELIRSIDITARSSCASYIIMGGGDSLVQKLRCGHEFWRMMSQRKVPPPSWLGRGCPDPELARRNKT